VSRALLHCGDVRQVLATLPERSVQCVVTSPPYWGLRDYGTAQWDGGDAGCDHMKPGGNRNKGRDRAASGGTFHDSPKTDLAVELPFLNLCGKCGARRVDNQLGLERTPEEYVANMVAVFREVRRILRDDGVLWLNLGDSYANTGLKEQATAYASSGLRAGRVNTSVGDKKPRSQPTKEIPPGIKPKDLVGIPWMVAFALRSDGWYLRSDVIWAKPNPMPESVTDRPTKAHEYLFLLTKSASYFYDAAAIAEESTCDRMRGPALHGDLISTNGNSGLARREMEPTRNARTVWTIATQSYAGAHFATFPEELARRCILAGSKPGDTCLDPFGGSGTVAAVATGHGRRAVYIDLNPAYLDLAEQRIGPMLCERAETPEAA
jgi:DNA modification methylase